MKTIPLTNSRKVAIVDDRDYEKISQHRWQLGGSGYISRGIRCGKRNVSIYMHREIAGTPKDLDTDHINFNRLDNRRRNLRIVTRSENLAHMRKHKSRSGRVTSSRFKGVSWNKERGCWRAKTKADGRHVFLGRFVSEVDAARAYDAFMSARFPGIAILNFS
jgi:hypothetical protein